MLKIEVTEDELSKISINAERTKQLCNYLYNDLFMPDCDTCGANYSIKYFEGLMDVVMDYAEAVAEDLEKLERRLKA